MRPISTALSTLLLSTALLSAPLAMASTEIPHDRVEVVFVLDTTGSMADLIDGAKRKIWSIATTIVETNPDADIAMALVAYRDRGDAYVVKTEQLSEDLQGLYGKLIKLEADGGDDTPESVNEALDKGVRGLQWSKGDDVKRIMFLVGDAPPHMDYPQERQYPEIVKDAVARGIIVNTVQAGNMPETTPVWQEIAQFGHGRYMTIPQSGGEVTVVITPYDDDILHIQQELDRTVVPYGDMGERDILKNKMTDKAAAPKAVQIENSEYYSKRASKKEVITGGGDLIADIRNNSAALDKIDEEELPDELQSLPAAKRQAWIDEKLAERMRLERKIADLIEKRDANVLEQAKNRPVAKAGDSFDEAVKETLRTQLN